MRNLSRAVKKIVGQVTPFGALVAGVLLGALVTHVLLFGLDSHRNAEVNTVIFTENGFSPNKLFIEKGEVVRFINQSDDSFWPASDVHPTHSLYSDFDAKGSLPPGAEWEFTFDRVGPWHFHDHLKAHNLGVVYVFDKTINSIDDFCVGSEEEHDYCVINYIYKLVEHEGEVAAMHALQNMQLENKPRLHCHKLTHDIGHRAYSTRDGNIAQAEILAMCSGGFFHGIMEGLLSKYPDVQAAKNWCDEQSDFYSPFYKDFESRCAHGVGHGIGETALAQFDHDWSKLKALSEQAALECGVYDETKLFLEVCVSGVYSVVIDWIISTRQQDAHFNLTAPFAFCTGLETEIMVQECIWEFSQRLTLFHKNHAIIFENLPHYLATSGFLEQYGEWTAIAVGLQLGRRYIHLDDDGAPIEICRNKFAQIEHGCLKGLIEGYVISGIWGDERPRTEKLCRNNLFSSEEQGWCMDWADSKLSAIR